MEKYLKGKRVNFHFRENIEPNEILLDRLAQKRESELGISEKKFEVPLLKTILEGLFFFSIFLFFSLFAKTFQLQIIQGQKFLALAEGNKFIIQQIRAERGVVYDRNFEQLVFNQESFDLIYSKNNLERRISILQEISQILKVKTEDIEKKIIEASDSSEVLVAENLDHQTLIILQTKIGELPGFKIKENPVRQYPEGSLFAHLIGYKRKTGEKIGLEQSYDGTLTEKPGEILTERDARNNIISQKIVSLPESGKSLVLWLDADLQRKISQALENSLRATGAKSGAVVALDPKTGGVLSLVSWPSFDNNLFSQKMTDIEWQELNEDPTRPLFNRVISGGYLTGSTIKPLIAAAALEEKIINPEKKIYAPGFIEIPHRYDPEIIYRFEDWAVHGWTDMRKAIAQSVNVYFYTIGGGYKDQEGLGPSRIKKYLELFGWGKKTGVDLPGEISGLIPDPEWKKAHFEKEEDQIWYDGDTYNLSIGQGYLQVTPLEVAASFLPIANNGKMFQPQVAWKVVDSEKNLVEEIKPKIIRENFVNPKNLQVVREGMRQAVTGENSPLASAVLLNSLPVSAAAKTGTAEVSKTKEIYHNWVTVFAPYEDPEIVLTVMVEKVKGEQVAALPVAKEVLEWYFTR